MFNSSLELPPPYSIGKNIFDAMKITRGGNETVNDFDSTAQDHTRKVDSIIQQDQCNWEEDLKTLTDAMIFLDTKQGKIPTLSNKLELALGGLSNEQLDGFLQKIALEGIQNELPTLHTLTLSLISYTQMKELMLQKESEHSEGYTELSEIAADVSRYHRSPPQSKVKKSFFLELKRSLSFIINFIPNLINTFLIAFSLYDIGKDPQSAWEASAMLDVYYKFFMIPAALVVALKVLFPAVGLSVYAIAAGIIAIGIVALVVYVKWFQPCPNNLPHCHNLTQDVELGYQSPVIGREREIDHLVNMFSSLDKNTANHALLVGPPGVGKTEIVKGFAQRIVEGKGDIPSSLKNKKVFLINTAALVQGGMYGYADQMKFLLNRIKGREEEAIFFFDEVHVAAQERKLADYLKQELNRGRLHCIAATTTEEYEKTILADKAFDRRFEKIYVSDMDDVNVKEVLQAIVRDTTKCVIVDDQIIDLIIEKTNEVMQEERSYDDDDDGDQDKNLHHQPWFSVQVLTSAMNKVASSVDAQYVPPALTQKKSLLKSLQLSLNANTDFRLTTLEGRNKLRRIRAVEAEIDEGEELLRIKKAQIESFRVLQQDLQNRHHSLKNKATKALEREGSRRLEELKKFYWEYEYLIPQISKILDELKTEINDQDFKIVVDETLVNEVIQQLTGGGDDEDD